MTEPLEGGFFNKSFKNDSLLIQYYDDVPNQDELRMLNAIGAEELLS